MKISGFTLVRNGVRFDYPFLESIRSIFPLVDELVVNVGRGDDTTLSELQKLREELPARLAERLILFESDWPLDDPEKKRGGKILSEQTNLALERCTGDWCVYLQADEVLHEADLPRIREALVRAHALPGVDGLIFDYVHLYGSFDVVQRSRSVYRREVRAIRRSSQAMSVGDAQSFRGPGGKKLNAILSHARVFHYGWVRTPEAMKEKTFFMDQLYHGAPTAEQAATGTPHTGENYRYKKILGLYAFTGSHPGVMRERIAAKGWHWDLAGSKLVWSWRDGKKIALDWIERLTGIRLFEYRSYKRVG